jgi:hypothetical protein
LNRIRGVRYVVSEDSLWSLPQGPLP